jgi:hypothetical protein
MQQMIEAIELCLDSLDPKRPKTFKREELPQAQERAREGLRLALAYLKREGN